jgi:hypothetical protein
VEADRQLVLSCEDSRLLKRCCQRIIDLIIHGYPGDSQETVLVQPGASTPVQTEIERSAHADAREGSGHLQTAPSADEVPVDPPSGRPETLDCAKAGGCFHGVLGGLYQLHEHGRALKIRVDLKCFRREPDSRISNHLETVEIALALIEVRGTQDVSFGSRNLPPKCPLAQTLIALEENCIDVDDRSRDGHKVRRRRASDRVDLEIPQDVGISVAAIEQARPNAVSRSEKLAAPERLSHPQGNSLKFGGWKDRIDAFDNKIAEDYLPAGLDNEPNCHLIRTQGLHVRSYLGTPEAVITVIVLNPNQIVC